MKSPQPPIVIEIANPTLFDGHGSIIFLEYDDDDIALMAARRIAKETGRSAKVTNTETGATEIILATKNRS